MKTRFRGFLLTILLTVAACGGGGGSDNRDSPAPQTTPTPSAVTVIDIASPWTLTSPSAVGLDEVMLARAASDAAAIPRVRSLLVARRGQIVTENYFGGADAATRFDGRSITKSVMSLLVGIALASGKLASLDATVGDHLGTPYSLDAQDRAVTVRQLLTMTSRYQWHESDGNDYNQWVASGDHVQYLLDRRQTDPTGSFVYNSAAVNLLGVVLERAVAQPLPEYARGVLFQPLGIASAEWEQLEPNMVNAGSGIRMTARDLLRIGQLMLQGGRSASQQIVPDSWITAASMPKFSWRSTYGAQRSTTYGYLWWVADAPATTAAFAWGYGGQFIYVAPSLDMVAVATTQWQGLSAEADPTSFASSVLSIIVADVLPAVRN